MKQEKRCKYRIIILVLFLVSVFSSFSNLIAFGHSESSGVFDGMYIKYNYNRCSTVPCVGWVNGTEKVTYSHVSGDIYHVTWDITSPYDPPDTGSWDEDIQTRIVSNRDKAGPGPVDGDHTWIWIFTNISLNDIVPMHIAARDADFNVTRQLTYKTSGYGTLTIWELTEVNATAEHMYGPSVLWYENSTGILVAGRFTWYITSGEFTLIGNKIYELRGTNALPKKEAIPGYHYFFLISMFSIFAIVIVKYKLMRKKFR